jgi:hypothetical protein
MLRHFRSNPRLQQLLISRRCYSLLNNARVAPENLTHFYRTYRLPEDPFFPLFFAAKRGYLIQRERAKTERRAYILSRMRGLPPRTLAMVKYLGFLERCYHPGAQSPVWQRELFPGSKRTADRYARMGGAGWLTVFSRHLRALQDRYAALTDVIADRVLAAYLLELDTLLDVEHLRITRQPPHRPDRAEVTRAYRRLSLIHHPDRGGDHVLFIQTKWARDTLMGDKA